MGMGDRRGERGERRERQGKGGKGRKGSVGGQDQAHFSRKKDEPAIILSFILPGNTFPVIEGTHHPQTRTGYIFLCP
jgi:hypothetical protein